MSLEQVIETGKNIKLESISIFSQGTFWAGIIIGGILLIIGVLWWILDSGDMLGNKGFGSNMAMMVGIIVLISFCFSANKSANAEILKESKQYNKKLEQWERTIAMPFIKSLEPVKIPLNDVKLVEPPNGSDGNGAYLSIVYNQNGQLSSEKSWFNVKTTLNNNEKPFMEYKYLSKDLGHGIYKGKYYTVVYLPKNWDLKIEKDN